MLAEVEPLLDSLESVRNLGELRDTVARVLDDALRTISGPLLLAMMNDADNSIGSLVEPGATTLMLPHVYRAQEGGQACVTQAVSSGRRSLQRAMHNAMLNAMAQLVTRVADDLVTAVDELVAAGVVASRSEAVRLGLERLVDRYRRDEIGARIANGYRARPQSEAEVAWADESTLRMIAEEPW